MSELPLQPIRRLIEDGAKDMRISKDSIKQARSIAEEMIVRTSRIAADIAEGDERKTIMKRDLQQAWVEYFMGEEKKNKE